MKKIGIPHSHETGWSIENQGSTQITNFIVNLPQQTNIIILAPILPGQKGEHKKELLNYAKLGYEKFKINGEYYDFDNIPEIDKNKKMKFN